MSQDIIETHLWNEEHDYYCSDSNYYSREPFHHYETWGDFIDSGEPDADLSLNMVFRWDWIDNDDPENYDEEEKPEHDQLRLFIMGQRHGLFRVVYVDVDKTDEEAVMAYLRPRFEYLVNLWKPFSNAA